MKSAQIAAQLYTIRDHCTHAADFAASMKKIRAIGYTAVQISGVGPIPEAELVAVCRGEGLTICATHEPGAKILDETAQVIDRLGALQCHLTAYPFPAGIDFKDGAVLETLTQKLDLAGEKLRRAGITLSYHNHAIEFVKFHGVPFLEYLYQNTRPENLSAEIDTFWIHYGGGDVVEWCRKLRGRLPLIHLKDYGYTTENKHTLCEIGAGTLPFDRILPQAEASGCTWFVVEQDTTPGDPFVSLRQSYDYLRAHHLS